MSELLFIRIRCHATCLGSTMAAAEPGLAPQRPLPMARTRRRHRGAQACAALACVMAAGF